MPADKLILLSHDIRASFLKLAKAQGERKGGYSVYVDLTKTDANLPARLYCGGIHNGINKIDFVDVAHLGLSGVRRIAKTIFGDLHHTRIARIDWCIDLADLSVLELALYCRVARAQNCGFERSRTGITFYLRRSKQSVLLIYDRLGRLRSIRDPLAQYYSKDDRLTRVEVQLKGRGLPFRRFRDVERYSEHDLLPDISFWKLGRKREGLTTTDALAAEGLLRTISEYGLQATSKMYTAQTWAYLRAKYLVPASQSSFPNLNELMRQSVRAWLEGPIRFPRLGREVAL